MVDAGGAASPQFHDWVSVLPFKSSVPVNVNFTSASHAPSTPLRWVQWLKRTGAGDFLIQHERLKLVRDGYFLSPDQSGSDKTPQKVIVKQLPDGRS